MILFMILFDFINDYFIVILVKIYFIYDLWLFV